MGSCVDVQLPIQVYDHPLIVPGWFDEELIKKRNLFTGVYQHGGAWWIRVSTQVCPFNSLAILVSKIITMAIVDLLLVVV